MGATREKGLKARRRLELAQSLPAAREGESIMALETGQEIAWVIRDKDKHVTVGVSAVHRVRDRNTTYCSHEVPPEPTRFPALKSLNVCSMCERLWKRASAHEAAEARRASA